MTDRRAYRRAGPFLRRYYALKYRAFARERRPRDERRGLIMLQVDALAFTDLQRALEQGYCPTIGKLLRDQKFVLRRWFCGLPSATPYCQAGMFHGENDGIPAFRFYDKAARRLITCNAPEGVQYIRDGISFAGCAGRRVELREPSRRRRADSGLHCRNTREDVGVRAAGRLANGVAHAAASASPAAHGNRERRRMVSRRVGARVGRAGGKGHALGGNFPADPDSERMSSFASSRRWQFCSTCTSAFP